jgi:hypothetical protein
VERENLGRRLEVEGSGVLGGAGGESPFSGCSNNVDELIHFSVLLA